MYKRQGKNLAVFKFSDILYIVIQLLIRFVVISIISVESLFVSVSYTHLIHPGKIEEMIEKAKSEVEATIKEEGERALFETGVILSLIHI